MAKSPKSPAGRASSTSFPEADSLPTGAELIGLEVLLGLELPVGLTVLLGLEVPVEVGVLEAFVEVDEVGVLGVLGVSGLLGVLALLIVGLR